MEMLAVGRYSSPETKVMSDYAQIFKHYEHQMVNNGLRSIDSDIGHRPQNISSFCAELKEETCFSAILVLNS
jgi:hypothetical protein